MAVKRMAGHLIRRMQQNSTQIFASRMQSKGFELTSVQFAALNAIAMKPGSDQAKIASEIAYDRATIGGVIDRLQKKGLVERTNSTKDRRAKVLHVSSQGQSLLDEMLPVVEDLQEDILAPLTEEEKDEFLRLASKLIAPSRKASDQT